MPEINEINKIPLSFATCSIGTQSDTLPRKLSALHNAGFNAIELAFPDIQSHGANLLGHPIAADNYPELVTAAHDIRRLCDAYHLRVLMLQPFANFEGWPRGSREREHAFERARGWIEIMDAVGTDMLQVGSTDTPLEKLQGGKENIVSDLRELCDLLAAKNMRLAYENWAWSTHAPTWSDIWSIVRETNRPNIGLCLDTFQTAGFEWGDPTTSTGRVDDLSVGELDKRLEESMRRLVGCVPVEKIYLLQVSDAYLPVEAVPRERVRGEWPRARWSQAFRPLPYDGGYLPVEAVGRAVLKTGFRGWFSVEVFDSGPDGKGREYEIKQYAADAMWSAREFLEKCMH
ncbi:xylose isomerase-like protein [Aspergillus avenaceus]|uniref:Xylose isomerase-like protein n=1 Tax=Aspergillus avenaceus TaxID=36643 RepID=A0A5N6TEW2_ASPAV|nr:xylose isomerase-like protein [Aspergillus avenaceus]